MIRTPVSFIIPQRLGRNFIDALKNEDGEWISDQTTLSNMAHEYFRKLYSCESSTSDLQGYPASFPRLSDAVLSHIQRDVTDLEIREAAFYIGAFKAPGPDGIHASFFHTQWDSIGGKVCDFVKQVFEEPSKISSVNQTHIVLIPKVEYPESLKDLRPISLCNVSLKIVTKILASRIRGILGDLIDLNQSCFIAGRQCCDNILVVQEAIHSMRTRKIKKGAVALKIDLEKAYDRLNWDFIDDTLRHLGLGDKFRNVIMACISSSRMRVLWNGQPSEEFSPSRGLRQGDPISPYLFVLCMERLGHAIKLELSRRKWKPLKLSPSGPPITHLFFADDLILFGEASLQQMSIIKTCLLRFCEASGHKINLKKSKLFCSKGAHFSIAQELSGELGIAVTGDLGKYLAVPLLHRRVTRATYMPVMDKMEKKMAVWKRGFLTLSGRTVLIKSVLTAIPLYLMQSVQLPKSIIRDIEKGTRTFLWSTNNEVKKLRLVNWEKVVAPKEKGGLGIRDLEKQNKESLYNEALLGYLD